MAIYSGGYKAVRLSCDECDREPEGMGFESFKEAASWAREHNWVVQKEGTEWVHICPDCARAIGLLPPDEVEMQPTPGLVRPKAIWKNPWDVK